MLISVDLFAQQREQPLTGARPVGMGETFVAIADDGNAVYWNPAGLPELKRLEFNSMYTPNLHGVGLDNTYISFALPIFQRIGLGASWLHLGLNDVDENGNGLEGVRLQFSRNITNLSLGVKVNSDLSLGSSIKYFGIDINDGGKLSGKAETFGVDVGARYALPIPKSKCTWLRQINLGLMVYDLGGTKLRFEEGAEPDTVFPQLFRFGVAFFPQKLLSLKGLRLKDALLAIDIDDRAHVGAEAWVNDHLALRAGVQKDRFKRQDEGFTYSFGTSLKFKSLQLDYAYSLPPILPATHLVSFSFTRSPSPVEIKGIELYHDKMFASLYKYHNASRMGIIKIMNNHDREVEVVAKASVAGLTPTETSERITLRPKQTTYSDFSVRFSNAILKVKGTDNTHQIKIRLEYDIDGEIKVAEETKEFDLYGRGAMTWDEPGKASAFITKQADASVDFFAIAALRDLPYRSEIAFGNLHRAARLFNALCLLGFEYRLDPINPFPDFRKDQYQVDFVQYPAESLRNRKGDCDDLTVLYASLLEYAGIATALMMTDDHITLMFDSGIHEKNWGVLPLDHDYVIRERGTLWIPVEVVELDSSFTYAWQKGAEWKRANEVTTTFVRDVEGIYQSAIPEDLNNFIADSTLAAKLADWRHLFAGDTTWIREKIAESIASCNASIQMDPINVELRNKFGIILALQDSLESAKAQFEAILRTAPQDSPALVNLANTHFVLGEFEDAEKYYHAAESQLTHEPGLFLNLAIFYAIQSIDSPDSLDDQNRSEKYLALALSLLQGDEPAALDLVGLTRVDFEISEKVDFKAWLKKKSDSIEKFIRDGVQKYLTHKPVAGTRLRRAGIKRRKDTDQSYILWWAENRRGN